MLKAWDWEIDERQQLENNQWCGIGNPQKRKILQTNGGGITNYVEKKHPMEHRIYIVTSEVTLSKKGGSIAEEKYEIVKDKGEKVCESLRIVTIL